mmetsp:Transcript_25600/g.42018  ORF Transcript_25600/g.42018 Transcript_25600/m.42018 type:complete len:145 (+) Transcript_25600:75-509(+)|eukprot:CAMPEP_0178778632 /NCGR_PEP_ID=MMETSP0745-20121128/1098_1 /TAXON_ID=913974 /ORGANISM="Nitzschia punctata, Strain CCMP561" /LENGTH=144 /DNA_ID=CAMNT_0020435775 /DNA_START=21 /DNA_END=455 /DNA_ORIENTATION=+
MSFSSLSASASSFAQSATSSRNKRVSFSNVEVIELPMMVGDGPSIGVPLTVDWKPQERSTFPLEFFEQFRPQRKDKNDLRIGPDSRERVLLKNGCSANEIEQGSRRASTLRKERFYTVQSLRILQQIETCCSERRPAGPTTEDC